MTMNHKLTIAASAIVVACWMYGCGGKVLGGQEVVGVGGSGHGASVGGSGGTAGKGGTAGFGGTSSVGGNTGSGGGSGGCAVPPPASCPNATGGPTLVPVCGGYCIDATEVTASQYQAWLATSPSTTLLPSFCTSWKSSYNGGAYTGNHPVATVDWCDAYGYCKAVGKRLCGRIGSGANNWGDYSNAGLSQWYNACTSGGAIIYPYGNTYQSQTCNGSDHGSAAVPVGSLSGCESWVSGYSGVHDLSGNVEEWEDSCDGTTGPHDGCRMRGGSFLHGGIDLACGQPNNGGMRNYHSNNVGFRCCSDP